MGIVRWGVHFNIALTRLVSYNMDYYWMLNNKPFNRHKVMPFIPFEATKLIFHYLRMWICLLDKNPMRPRTATGSYSTLLISSTPLFISLVLQLPSTAGYLKYFFLPLPPTTVLSQLTVFPIDPISTTDLLFPTKRCVAFTHSNGDCRILYSSRVPSSPPPQQFTEFIVFRFPGITIIFMLMSMWRYGASYLLGRLPFQLRSSWAICTLSSYASGDSSAAGPFLMVRSLLSILT